MLIMQELVNGLANPSKHRTDFGEQMLVSAGHLLLGGHVLVGVITDCTLELSYRVDDGEIKKAT